MIKCEKCKKEYKAFPFFIKYCDSCQIFICMDCWKSDKKGANSLCPKCSSPLSQISDEKVIKYILRSLISKNKTTLYNTIDIKLLPLEVREKIEFDTDKKEIVLLDLLNEEERNAILKLAKFWDKRKLTTLFKEQREEFEFIKFQTLAIDMACIPICHFNV